MRSFIPLSIAMIAVLFTGFSSPLTRAEEEKIPTIKEIMQESHQCRTAYVRLVREELQKEEVDWGMVGTKSRALIQTGKLLAKNTPPKGSAESWEKLTSVYTANAVLLADAAERHDKETATRHQQAMYRMCATCHRAHR
jgi:hypothetical protein